MAPWSKEADWLPYTNAVEQVSFWKDDLIKIERSLMILDMMGVPKNDPGYQATLKEIKISKLGLKRAQFKLKEALDRLTDSDKINFPEGL